MLAQELVLRVEYRSEIQWWAQIQADIKRGVLGHRQAIAAKKTP